MFCSQCGEQNAPGAKFCFQCGTALSREANSAPPSVTTDEIKQYLEREDKSYGTANLIGVVLVAIAALGLWVTLTNPSSGDGLGPLPNIINMGLLGAFGIAVVGKKRIAILLGWAYFVLLTLMTALHGFIPLEIFQCVALLAALLYIRRQRPAKATAPSSPFIIDVEPVRKRRALNLRGGFNRLFVVVWVLYALGAMLFPFWLVGRERAAAFEGNSRITLACFADAREMPVGPGTERAHQAALDRCKRNYEQSMARDVEAYRPTAYYRAIGWHAFWIAPVALIVPPAIFYGVLRGTSSVTRCIAQGFTS